jgi:hypothetical protein
MYMQLGVDAGILAGFRHVEITMPDEIKAQNYKYKSGFASSKGLYALLPVTSHWSIKASIHQICLQENVEMLYANTSPDAYKSLKTDSLSLSCEPIFNKNSYKQTIQMQMMQLGLGVFYQNMSKKPLRYRVGAQANYLSVMNFDLKNKPMTNLVVDESTKKMDTYSFSKQNWSAEVQASLIYDISKKFRILSTVNYQFLTKDLFRGTSNVKAQNVGIHLGIEIALAKVK